MGRMQIHLKKAIKDEVKPIKLNETMAFMFESSYLLKLTPFAANNKIDPDYYKCWAPLQSHFQK